MWTLRSDTCVHKFLLSWQLSCTTQTQ